MKQQKLALAKLRAAVTDVASELKITKSAAKKKVLRDALGEMKSIYVQLKAECGCQHDNMAADQSDIFDNDDALAEEDFMSDMEEVDDEDASDVEDFMSDYMEDGEFDEDDFDGEYVQGEEDYMDLEMATEDMEDDFDTDLLAEDEDEVTEESFNDDMDVLSFDDGDVDEASDDEMEGYDLLTDDDVGGLMGEEEGLEADELDMEDEFDAAESVEVVDEDFGFEEDELGPGRDIEDDMDEVSMDAYDDDMDESEMELAMASLQLAEDALIKLAAEADEEDEESEESDEEDSEEDSGDEEDDVDESEDEEDESDDDDDDDDDDDESSGDDDLEVLSEEDLAALEKEGLLEGSTASSPLGTGPAPSKKLVQEAARLGKDSFAKGLPGAPAKNKPLMKLLEQSPNNTLPLLKAFNKEWTKAMLAAPVPGIDAGVSPTVQERIVAVEKKLAAAFL